MICTTCSRDLKPVVAVDIDGTLGNYHEHFTVFAEIYLNEALPHQYDGGQEFSEYLGLDKRVYRDIKLAYRQGGMKRSMPMYPGADKFMQVLHHNGIELWIATTRPWQRLDNVDPDTREWLRRCEIPYDFMIYGDDKYDQLYLLVDKERILTVIDDQPEACQQAATLGLNARQPIRPHNEGDPYLLRFPSFNAMAQEINFMKHDWEAKHGER